jgi:hypothetical protein
MQTFVPWPVFSYSAYVLDMKRLNKQITEAKQILNALDRKRKGITAGWQNHPAVRMWEGFEMALMNYHNACVLQWWDRGYSSHDLLEQHAVFDYPDWWGDVAIHQSHQANLVRKDPDFYAPRFPGVEPSDVYVWPV